MRKSRTSPSSTARWWGSSQRTPPPLHWPRRPPVPLTTRTTSRTRTSSHQHPRITRVQQLRPSRYRSRRTCLRTKSCSTCFKEKAGIRDMCLYRWFRNNCSTLEEHTSSRRRRSLFATIHCRRAAMLETIVMTCSFPVVTIVDGPFNRATTVHPSDWCGRRSHVS